MQAKTLAFLPCHAPRSSLCLGGPALLSPQRPRLSCRFEKPPAMHSHQASEDTGDFPWRISEESMHGALRPGDLSRQADTRGARRRRAVFECLWTALATVIASGAAPRSTAASESLPGGPATSEARGIAVLAGGFSIPTEQYESYAQSLSAQGWHVDLFEDSTFGRRIDNAAAGVCDRVQAWLRRGNGDGRAVLLAGHSRGCKHVVLAARSLLAAGIAVNALFLIDPVDATMQDPESVLDVMKTLHLPVLIVGAAGDDGGCAPAGSNYRDFFEAMRAGGCDGLLAVVEQAGHTQFLDARASLVLDPCAAGREQDLKVGAFCRALLTLWGSSFPPGGANGRSRDSRAVGSADAAAIETLRQQGEMLAKSTRVKVTWVSA